MPRQLTFTQNGIASILRVHRLKVPPNQREYSWEDKQVKELFHDLNNAIHDNAPEYFLGTIVAIPRGPDSLEIVDGQQRLATTAILLSAMRDYLRDSPDDEIIFQDLGHLLTFADRSARRAVPRLTLNVTDNQYFQEKLASTDAEATAPRAISHRLIDAAFERAREHVSDIVKGHAEKKHGDILNSWITYLEHNATVILLQVPTEINAYSLFETLNDRGLRASQADLIKNYLFGKAADRLPEAQHRWSSLRSILESIDDSDEIVIDFLRQMLISMYGHLRESQVYTTVQERAKGVNGAMELLANLEEGSIDYAALRNPEHEKWNNYPQSIRKAVSTFLILKTKPMRPLLLSIAGRFTPRESVKALRFLISLSVRLLIAGGARSGTVEEALASAAKSVTDKEIVTARALMDELRAITPGDTRFGEEFRRASVPQAAFARYILRSLELTHQGSEEPCFVPSEDPTVVNLEHVLPRNPEDSYPAFSEEEHKIYLNRIGNLALLQVTPNRKGGSEAFSEKRPTYAASAFELTKHLAQTSDWNPQEIESRQARLVDLAVRTWATGSL